MFIKLIILFSVIPLVELLILIRIGTYIGALNTILLVLTTAIIGAALARRQGINTIWRIRQSLSNGKLPADELLDGFIIIIAALFLITPGLLTDTMGFILLIPQTRRIFKKWVERKIRNWIDRSGGSSVRFGP